MRDDAYEEALDRLAEQFTAEDVAAAARFANAAAVVLPLLAGAIEALAEIPPPDPEAIRELDRRITIELLRRGVIRQGGGFAVLKRIIYTDFGQFIAALKSAERLGLRYRVERWQKSGTIETVSGGEQPHTYVEFTLDILPDETEAGEEQATA